MSEQYPNAPGPYPDQPPPPYMQAATETHTVLGQQGQPNYGAAGQPNYGAPGGYVDPSKMPAGAAPPPVYPVQGVPQGYTVTTNTTQVVVVGGCPACRVGVLEDDYPCIGVCCAILFFPLGVLCCLAMRQRRCSNCGATFG